MFICPYFWNSISCEALFPLFFTLNLSVHCLYIFSWCFVACSRNIYCYFIMSRRWDVFSFVWLHLLLHFILTLTVYELRAFCHSFIYFSKCIYLFRDYRQWLILQWNLLFSFIIFLLDCKKVTTHFTIQKTIIIFSDNNVLQ